MASLIVIDPDYLQKAAHAFTLSRLDAAVASKPCSVKHGWVGKKPKPGCKRAKKGTAARIKRLKSRKSNQKGTGGQTATAAPRKPRKKHVPHSPRMQKLVVQLIQKDIANGVPIWNSQAVKGLKRKELGDLAKYLGIKGTSRMHKNPMRTMIYNFLSNKPQTPHAIASGVKVPPVQGPQPGKRKPAPAPAAGGPQRRAKRNNPGATTDIIPSKTTYKEFNDLKDAIAKRDFKTAAKHADTIYTNAQQRAKDAGGDFYDGISSGNNSVEDWIMKEMYGASGYDDYPRLVKSKAIDNAFKNDQIVMYRSTSSTLAKFQKRFDDFKDGDYFAGHGIYGHGTYVAHAQKNSTSPNRKAAVNGASAYGSGVMRMALEADAKVQEYDDNKNAVLGFKRMLDSELSSGNISKREHRRLSRVMIGDDDGYHISGRLAMLQGYDGVRLDQSYNNTYFLLLNRSKTMVDEQPGQLNKV